MLVLQKETRLRSLQCEEPRWLAGHGRYGAHDSGVRAWIPPPKWDASALRHWICSAVQDTQVMPRCPVRGRCPQCRLSSKARWQVRGPVPSGAYASTYRCVGKVSFESLQSKNVEAARLTGSIDGGSRPAIHSTAQGLVRASQGQSGPVCRDVLNPSRGEEGIDTRKF